MAGRPASAALGLAAAVRTARVCHRDRLLHSLGALGEHVFGRGQGAQGVAAARTGD